MRLYGIWCFDAHGNKGDWLREPPSKMDYGETAILAYQYQSEAKERAAKEYGYEAYNEAKKDGWVEIRRL